jgi:hypothetical protein
MTNERGKRREDVGESELATTTIETVRAELERVRAHFGVDPALESPHYLAGAWTSPSGAVEENEAEFVDAMADCVSVGLPLDAAVAFWSSGFLAHVDDDIEDDAGEAVRTA